jgi:putative chitinase
VISIATLIIAGVGPTQAKAMSAPLKMACAQFQIDTPARMGAFVGQCMVETGCFTQLEENLYYSNPQHILKTFPHEVPSIAEAQLLAKKPEALGNRVYANRLGNGDEASGDGYRYRGRGCIQITGRSHYSDASVELGVDYLGDPGLVGLAEGACLTAAWFWHIHKLNVLADAWAIDAITRQVNGSAMRDSSLRKQFGQQAHQAFS